MLITNARVALSATTSACRNVLIRRGRMFFTAKTRSANCIDLAGHLLLPGLINAHDHLEFNLFPRLGRRIYTNATEWAADIHRPHESPVREHLLLPKRDRLIWGGLRNLLSGVTTVAHHNPYDSPVFANDFPVRVLRRYGWAHSLAFSSEIAIRFRETRRDWPFLIHAGEGTDAAARAEFVTISEMGILDNRTVLVHALGFDGAALETIRRRHSSIVWCPSSNLLTYGQTLRSREGLRLALGTDSAISAAGDMMDELRIAHHDCGASLESLYEIVTEQAASILRVPAGTLGDSAPADIVAVPDRGQTPAEALLHLTPKLVIVGGRVHLVSKELSNRFPADRVHRISLDGRGEWLTPFNIPALLQRARHVLGGDIRLAGKRVSQ